VVRETLNLVVDLRGELARRREDQRAGRVVRFLRAGFTVFANQPGEYGQHVRRGLARTCFRAANHVAACERVRQDRALHGRGLFEASLIERVEQRRFGDELFEFQRRRIERR
jgi:hypothetical protein